MDKLKLAHDWALVFTQHNKDLSVAAKTVSAWAFDYAEAMQAEADKREPSGLPEALCEVDWNQATDNTIAWFMLRGSSSWLLNDFRIVCAPSFGFTGSHIVERPDGF